ncbi:glycosyl hydrolase [Podospora australis]|uniref:Glycosyl hydrolase n=1 Tax=Podospora australis TaxID=1536484 RepID=A0AAN6WL67_9PEZI|nr:glycosyl hydrolase [Podospora australis]
MPSMHALSPLFWGLNLLPLFVGAAPSSAAADKPYSTWMADSIISYNIVPQTRWYTEATFYRGIEAVYNHTASPTYLSYLTTQIDAILTSNGSIKGWDFADHQLDNIRIGSTILYLYTVSAPKNPRYKAAIDFLHDRLLNHQNRTPSGGFWHKDPKYPNQMWLDGLFMAGPFSAAYAALFDAGKKDLWDDILLQFALVEKHCRNQTSGMLKHGYDESLKAVWADPVTGESPHVWIRAQGWYFVALVDVLDWFPRSHPGWETMKKWFVQLAQAVKRTQDKRSGGWWLVMDEGYPGRAGNYIESSGTAMYTYGLLKGIRVGILDEKEYFGVAERAWGLMTERFVARNGTNGGLNWEGTVRVGSLDGKGDYNYYIGINRVENDLKGVGPFLMASVEMEAYKARTL